MSSEPDAPAADDRALSLQPDNLTNQDGTDQDGEQRSGEANAAIAAQEASLTHEPDVDFRSISIEAEEGASKFALVPGLVRNPEAGEPDTAGLTAAGNVAPTGKTAAPPVGERTSEIHAAVWRLAWPSVLTMLLQTFNGLMDTLFVGHLPHSKQALAATGIGGQIIFLLISLAMGVSVGTRVDFILPGTSLVHLQLCNIQCEF